MACASPAAAQKDKKKKPASQPADSTNPLVPMSDENQIDYMISEVLGAWQVGDVEKLHKDYGDDVTVVNGAYAPPIIGWTNYLAVYQQQRARMQQVRMDRINTVIKVRGNFCVGLLSVGFCRHGRRATRQRRRDKQRWCWRREIITGPSCTITPRWCD